jgi:hypothetical protein
VLDVTYTTTPQHHRFILHDWNDADCGKILCNLRAAMGDTKDVRLLVCDICLPDRDRVVDPVPLKYLMDMHMCVMLGSKERSRGEWEALLRPAGFEVVAFHPTRSIIHVVEARPV